MRNPKYDDIDDLDSDDDDQPAFQRMRKQTGKTQTAKGDRRQQQKEWGKAIAKFQKQRAKTGKP